LYEVASARDRKLAHPDFPDHFVVFSAAAEAGSGTTRGTVHTARQELIAAGVITQREHWERDPSTQEPRRHLYYAFGASDHLAESMAAAAEAAEAALEDKPERAPRQPRPRCIHCNAELVCAACGCAQVHVDMEVEGDVQILNVAQPEEGSPN